MSGNAGPTVLSFHAIDTLAEEGLLVDAAVVAELRCRAAAVVTAVLVAGPGGIQALESTSLALVAQQFESVLDSGRPASIRIGLTVDPQQLRLIAELIRDAELPAPVVAPVFKVGKTALIDETARQVLRDQLFPLARVVVLRAGDLAMIDEHPVRDVEGMRAAAHALRKRGARAVLIAGMISGGRVIDLLDDDGRVALFDASRVAAPRIGGLSGVHAAALSAHLARGASLPRAVDAAQRYVSFRLQRSL